MKEGRAVVCVNEDGSEKVILFGFDRVSLNVLVDWIA